MSEFDFERVIRTTSSERYLVQRISNPDSDIASVDIHYVSQDSAATTLILFDSEYFTKTKIDLLIGQIDQRLLPMVCFNEGDLTVTVVSGEITGEYKSDGPSD